MFENNSAKKIPKFSGGSEMSQNRFQLIQQVENKVSTNFQFFNLMWTDFTNFQFFFKFSTHGVLDIRFVRKIELFMELLSNFVILNTFPTLKALRVKSQQSSGVRFNER